MRSRPLSSWHAARKRGHLPGERRSLGQSTRSRAQVRNCRRFCGLLGVIPSGIRLSGQQNRFVKKGTLSDFNDRVNRRFGGRELLQYAGTHAVAKKAICALHSDSGGERSRSRTDNNMASPASQTAAATVLQRIALQILSSARSCIGSAVAMPMTARRPGAENGSRGRDGMRLHRPASLLFITKPRVPTSRHCTDCPASTGFHRACRPRSALLPAPRPWPSGEHSEQLVASESLKLHPVQYSLCLRQCMRPAEELAAIPSDPVQWPSALFRGPK